MKAIQGSQIKAIWAGARERGIDKQSVYDIIFGVSGKEHMTELTYSEAAQVLDKIKGHSHTKEQKRTDEGGDPQTVSLRRKIYTLTGQLGWNNNNDRINGFSKKMFGVERVEWLKTWQCHKLIEALKKMVERMEESEHGGTKEA